MSSFVITVKFSVAPQHLAEFRKAMLHTAAASLEREPGCRRFDVCESASSPDFFLYEVYDSEADFQAHLEADHFTEFDRMTSPWVVSKAVSLYARLTTAPSWGRKDRNG